MRMQDDDDDPRLTVHTLRNGSREAGDVMAPELSDKAQLSLYDDTRATRQTSPSFRRKARASIRYILACLFHDTVTVKLAQRTFWPNVLAVVWLYTFLAALVALGLPWLSKRYNRKGMSIKSSVHNNGASPVLETTRPSLLSSKSLHWQDTALMTASTLVAAVCHALQAGQLQVNVFQAINLYDIPALVIIPSILSPASSPVTSLVEAYAPAVPAVFALILFGTRVSAHGAVVAILYALSSALRLVVLTDPKYTRERSGQSATSFSNSAPYICLLSTIFILPTAIRCGAGSHLPHNWIRYPLMYCLSAFFKDTTLKTTLRELDSPLVLLLLHFPKAWLISILQGPSPLGPAAKLSSEHFNLVIVLLCAGLALGMPPVRARLHAARFWGNSRGLLSSPTRGSSATGTSSLLASYASFLPIFCCLLGWSGFISPIYNYPRQMLSSVRDLTPSLRTVDVVISFYNEDPRVTRNLTRNLLYYPWIRQRDPRFILYLKNDKLDAEKIRKSTGVHEVIRLDNRGREAGTYLQHILRNYNASIDPASSSAYRGGLADHTIFLQEHLAWDWIARDRLWLFSDQTGYLHLAPYIKMDCGKDLEGNGNFERYPQLYGMFREGLCPPTLQLGGYSAQFVVSKERILQNSYAKYHNLDSILEADAGHWIHQEGTWWKYHGDTGPSNPYLGHVLERSWPIIFDCENATIADTCTDANYTAEGCQCLDLG